MQNIPSKTAITKIGHNKSYQPPPAAKILKYERAKDLLARSNAIKPKITPHDSSPLGGQLIPYI